MENRPQLSAKERTTKTVECDRMIQSRPAADNTSYLNRLPVIRSVAGLETGIWKCGPVQSAEVARVEHEWGLGGSRYRNGKGIDGGWMKDCVVQYYSRSDMEVEERVNGRVKERGLNELCKEKAVAARSGQPPASVAWRQNDTIFATHLTTVIWRISGWNKNIIQKSGVGRIFFFFFWEISQQCSM